MKKDVDNLVWIDLEMTGLYPENDVILEIATIVTDKQLNIISEGPSLVIFQEQSVLDDMSEWCKVQHAKSGLTRRVVESSVSIEQAESLTLNFIKQYVYPHKAPLCGNTIGQDRRFLYKYMPDLSDFLHYRSVDVSSFKEVLLRWYPDKNVNYAKSSDHRALDDIRESINELKFYKDKFFI